MKMYLFVSLFVLIFGMSSAQIWDPSGGDKPPVCTIDETQHCQRHCDLTRPGSFPGCKKELSGNVSCICVGSSPGYYRQAAQKQQPPKKSPKA